MSESEGSSGSGAVVGGAVATGCGCMMAPLAVGGLGVVVVIFGGLGVLFAPIIALILFFGGGGSGSDSGHEIDTDKVSNSVQGDGKGELNEKTVPTDLADTIKDAGSVCDAIGPVVIAAQIEHASSFNKDMLGSDGKKGISQLPPDKFDEFGEDKDDNDKTRATDPEDSIMAQGKYLCSLVDKVTPIVDASDTPKDKKPEKVLDLALAAYDVGFEKVEKAKDIPDGEAASYVFSVRSLFPRFEGIGGALPPDEYPTPSDYPTEAS
ncbi:transglycosylase SLT domain-containing protein [Streptomyces axinellae]|uniref:Transglycosylase SLT domain-containing protein n=1 Tax=Streptomyces axinellae TaxID=552788 RepID=A0ABP6CBP7_9ACTN